MESLASADSRAEFGHFLRSKRESLDPQSMGLPMSGRKRRTPGLRREEVAQMAGVSVTWYTWLEQGRRIRPSSQVLHALAGVPRLSQVETNYLFQLAEGTRPSPRSECEEPGSAELHRDFLALLDPAPSYIVNRSFDVIERNQSSLGLLPSLIAAPAERRNLLIAIYTDIYLQETLRDWKREALASKFHEVAVGR